MIEDSFIRCIIRKRTFHFSACRNLRQQFVQVAMRCSKSFLEAHLNNFFHVFCSCKADFNRQLQTFLTREVGRLKSDYESIKGMNSDN